MAKRKKSPPPPDPAPSPEPDPGQRLWQNGWGMTMASLTLTAPPQPDDTAPVVQGFQVWFEPPRHGWLFPHVELVGCGEFVCRASNVENDFLGDLVEALRGILGGKNPAQANAFGEPQTFRFRFSRTEDGDVRCDIVTFNRFVEPVVEEPVLGISAAGETVCRAFCFGLRELYRTVPPESYTVGYSHPFPTEALAALCAALGGEFADGLG